MLLAMPYIPEGMNGSAMFAERFSVWVILFVMAAASLLKLRPRHTYVALAFGAVLLVGELGVLQTRIGPVAQELQVASYPARQLSDVRVLAVNARSQPTDLTFDPYWLSSVRMVDRGNGLLVDCPWLGLQIIMLERKGPKLERQKAPVLLHVAGDPSAGVALVWNSCVTQSNEPPEVAEIERHGATQWHVEQYGCFKVAEQLRHG